MQSIIQLHGRTPSILEVMDIKRGSFSSSVIEKLEGTFCASVTASKLLPPSFKETLLKIASHNTVAAYYWGFSDGNSIRRALLDQAQEYPSLQCQVPLAAHRLISPTIPASNSPILTSSYDNRTEVLLS